jgi:O-antigen/teichoic acid export membrane protein
VLRQALAKLSKHTLIYAVAEQCGRLASFLLLPLTTGYLSESDFATRELLAITLAVLAQVCGINLTAAMSRLYFDDADPVRRRRVLSTSIATVSVAAIGAALLGGVLADTWAPWLPAEASDLPHLARIALGIFVFQTLRELQNKVLQTQERSVLFGVLSVSKLVFEILAQIVALVHFEAGIEGLLWAVLLSEAVFALLLTALLWPAIGFAFSGAVLASLVAYAAPLIPNGILQFGLHSLDRYLVGAICGADQLGLYALAYKLGYVPNYLVLGPFLLIWYPFVFSIAERDRQREMVGRLIPIVMLLMSAAALGMALFAEEIVQLAASRDGFLRAWPAVPFIALGYWMWGLFQLLQTGFYAAKATRALPLLTASAVIVNAFANLVLLPWMGFVGAAVATVITFAALCAATHDRARRDYPLVIAWRRVWVPLAIGAALAAAAVLLPLPGGAPRWAVKALAFGVWIPCALWSGVSANERRSAWAALRQRLGPPPSSSA